MSMPVHLLGISGSLRKGSFNTALLHAARELLPEDVTLELFDIKDIPLYNADMQAQGFPESVQALRDRLQAADAVLIATPEYNYSVPGVLKNALDWVSRLPDQPFNGKPMALMGASPGAIGTARAQYHLRQIMVFLNGHVLNRPEVFVGKASEKFDQEGRLTDEQTRKMIKAQLEALAAWTRRLRGA